MGLGCTKDEQVKVICIVQTLRKTDCRNRNSVYTVLEEQEDILKYVEMDALGTKCWLCQETARPKAKWASVLDQQVAESICKLLWLETKNYIEFFTSADYCGSCHEFVLQIDFLVRTMRAIKTKILDFRSKLSQAVIQNIELSATVGEISPRYEDDDEPLFSPENQDVPSQTSPSDTTAEPHADSPTGVFDSPAFEQTPVVVGKLESNSVSSPNVYHSGSEQQSLLAIYLTKTSPKMNFNQTIPELQAEPSPGPPKAAEIQPDADVYFEPSTIAVSVRRQTRSFTSAIQKPIISYHDGNNSGTESDSDDVSLNGDSEFLCNISDSGSNDDEGEAEPDCPEDSLKIVSVFSQQNDNTELSINTTTTGALRTSSRKRKATRESRYYSESDNISSEDDLSSESDSSSKTSKRQKTSRNKRKARKNESRGPVNKRVSLTVEQRTAKADGKFYCFHGKCSKKYLRVRDLKKHIYLWHTERTPEEDESMKRFPCREPECSFFSRSGFALEVHMHKVHKNDPRPYKCIPCKKDYGTHSKLIVHNNKNHRRKEFVCHICGQQHSRKSELDYHMLKKHNDTEGLKCKVCHQKFFFKEDCDKHEEKHVPGGPLSLTCLVMYCKKVFENQEVLRQHVVESHYGAKKLFCEYCAATASNPFLLKMHLKTHSGVFEFPCTDCEKRFRSKSLQQSHFETVHAVDKTIYPCKLCDKTFHCKSYLYKHNAWHKHGINANKPLSKQKKIPSLKDADN